MLYTVWNKSREYTEDVAEWATQAMAATAKMPVNLITDAALQHIGGDDWRAMLGGYWAKMAVFSPLIEDEYIFYTDLDTLFYGDFPKFFEGLKQTGAESAFVFDPYNPADGQCSGVMYLTRAMRARVWADYSAHWRDRQATYNVAGMRCDMGYLARFLAGGLDMQRWRPSAVVSYKAHVLSQLMYNIHPSEATRVIYFHGRPRPWSLLPADLQRLKCPLPPLYYS